MAFTWRGTVLERGEIIGRGRILGYRLLFRFEIVENLNVREVHEESWDYTRESIAGKTPLQLRTMILVTGGPTFPVDPPAPPGTMTPPEPPPMLQRGNALLQEFLDTQQARGFGLPVSFVGP